DFVVGKGVRGQLTGFQKRVFVVQEGVGHVLDRDRFRVWSRLAAGVQGVLLLQVLRQGAVGIVPRSEGVQFAPDLLAPVAGRVAGFWGWGLAGFSRGVVGGWRVEAGLAAAGLSAGAGVVEWESVMVASL